MQIAILKAKIKDNGRIAKKEQLNDEEFVALFNKLKRIHHEVCGGRGTHIFQENICERLKTYSQTSSLP
jgi:hypothetical protein